MNLDACFWRSSRHHHCADTLLEGHLAMRIGFDFVCGIIRKTRGTSELDIYRILSLKLFLLRNLNQQNISEAGRTLLTMMTSSAEYRTLIFAASNFGKNHLPWCHLVKIYSRTLIAPIWCGHKKEYSKISKRIWSTAITSKENTESSKIKYKTT